VQYWGYFILKLAAGAGLMRLVWVGMYRFFPEPETFLYHRVSRFGQDLEWTLGLFGYWMAVAGLLAVIVWDQRRRCRICLRRLRMPVENGSWSLAALLNPPRRESICPYGHGTLAEPEVHTSATQEAEWRQHAGIWDELESLDRKR
jgi:hypothetical protein